MESYALPRVQVADLHEREFPINDYQAAELLQHAAIPISLPFHPRKFFAKMKLLTASQTTKIYICNTQKNDTAVVKKLRIRESDILQSYVDLEVGMSMLCGNCEYVVDFYCVFRTEKNIWLVMEHMVAGSLAKIRSAIDFREREIAYVMRCVLRALVYLHRRHRIHRDLKAHNVLVNAEGQVKLIDFGWAAQLTHAHPTTSLAVGSIFWMAPEVHAGKL
jgi:serine/threonine protein kinase